MSKMGMETWTLRVLTVGSDEGSDGYSPSKLVTMQETSRGAHTPLAACRGLSRPTPAPPPRRGRTRRTP